MFETRSCRAHKTTNKAVLASTHNTGWWDCEKCLKQNIFKPSYTVNIETTQDSTINMFLWKREICNRIWFIGFMYWLFEKRNL